MHAALISKGSCQLGRQYHCLVVFLRIISYTPQSSFFLLARGHFLVYLSKDKLWIKVKGCLNVWKCLLLHGRHEFGRGQASDLVFWAWVKCQQTQRENIGKLVSRLTLHLLFSANAVMLRLSPPTWPPPEEALCISWEPGEWAQLYPEETWGLDSLRGRLMHRDPK